MKAFEMECKSLNITNFETKIKYLIRCSIASRIEKNYLHNTSTL
jgi:hypothetical protein